MNEEELRYVESGQRQHHEVMLHQSKISAAVESEELTRFAILKPTLQEGIAGFGETPHKAIMDWNLAWHKKANRT